MHDTTTAVTCHLRTVRGIDQPVVFVQDGKVFASSEDVAAYFGKRHADVLRDIRRLISHNNSCACNFAFTQRDVRMPSGGIRPTAVCNMDRDGFTLLAMGFTGKKALAWKLRYIEAYNAMEIALAAPKAPEEPSLDAQTKKGLESGKLVVLERGIVDEFLEGFELMVTAKTALEHNDWFTEENISAICNTIDRGIERMRPLKRDCKYLP